MVSKSNNQELFDISSVTPYTGEYGNDAGEGELK